MLKESFLLEQETSAMLVTWHHFHWQLQFCRSMLGLYFGNYSGPSALFVCCYAPIRAHTGHVFAEEGDQALGLMLRAVG